jgi:hypothetical protein
MQRSKHANAAIMKSSGLFNHTLTSTKAHKLLKTECNESSRAKVGRCRGFGALASRQKSWIKATDIEKTKAALTRKANARPMLTLASCFEMDEPSRNPWVTSFPSRLL